MKQHKNRGRLIYLMRRPGNPLSVSDKSKSLYTQLIELTSSQKKRRQ